MPRPLLSQSCDQVRPSDVLIVFCFGTFEPVYTLVMIFKATLLISDRENVY